MKPNKNHNKPTKPLLNPHQKPQNQQTEQYPGNLPVITKTQQQPTNYTKRTLPNYTDKHGTEKLNIPEAKTGQLITPTGNKPNINNNQYDT